MEVGPDCPAQRELARLANRQGAVFELAEPIPAVRAELKQIVAESRTSRWDVAGMVAGGQAFRPFSFGSEGSSALLLGFKTLPEGDLRLWFQVEQTENRSFPPDSQTPPPERWPGKWWGWAQQSRSGTGPGR